MIGIIGNTLWLGLGIALNPIAIVISVLVANKENPQRNGIALVLGWILGLAILVALPALVIHDQLHLPNGRPHMLIDRLSYLDAALGIVLLLGAAVSFVRGPLPGDQPVNPRWARILDSGGVGRMVGMGAFLSIVNLRNLILLAAAASVIGQAGLDSIGVMLVVALFVSIATLGILLPLLIRLFGGESSEARLRAWSNWLNLNIGLITGVIMALFGALLLTKGIREVM